MVNPLAILGFVVGSVGIIVFLSRGTNKLDNSAEANKSKPTFNDPDAATRLANNSDETKQSQKIETLATIQERLPLLAMETSKWSLAVQYHHKDYPLLDPKQIAEQVLKTRSKESSFNKNSVVESHKTSLSKFFRSIQFNGDEEIKFLGSETPPIEVANKDGQLCLIITDFACTKVYNTLRLTEKQRAAKILISYILPIWSKVDEALYDSKIPFYCVCYFYGSRDFSDESFLPRGSEEILAMIVSRENVHEFANGKISQEKLIHLSELYIGSKGVKPRRVEIMID
jgi:hypothetical protein